jgi:hypothetical protein
MACGGCAKRRATRHAAAKSNNPVMGGYKYLTDVQIRARLESYKKRNCPNCGKRYECDYTMYVKCKNIK